jgi:hypothetical protein
MAADWNFYGSARMWTGMRDIDKETTVGGVNNVIASSPTETGQWDDQDLEWQDLGNSRLGASVKANDQISGGFEIGFDGGTIYHRKVFGIYDWGGGKLLVGRDYTPMSIFYSGRGSAGDDGMNSWGGTYDGRRNQIKLMIGGLNIALIQPNSGGVVEIDDIEADEPELTAYSADDTDFTLPKIAVGYKFKTDMMEINPYAGYQTVDYVTQDEDTGAETDESLASYVVGIGAKFNFGAAYVNGNVYYSENPKAYGLSQGALGLTYLDSNGKFQDNTSYAALLVAGFKISEMFTVEAGYGYIKGTTDLEAGVELENDASCYYVNFPITITPGFFIVPEFAVEDYGDVEASGGGVSGKIDAGKTTYYGIRWQIDF